MADSLMSQLSVPGTVPAPENSLDCGVAWHYGDPLGEQRAAVTGAILIDRSHRGVITLSGGERLSWLNTISSQLTTSLSNGTSAENLSLDANGRIEDYFVVTELNDLVTIDTPAERTSQLANFLTKMVFWADVKPMVDPTVCVLSLVGRQLLSHPALSEIGVSSTLEIYQATPLIFGDEVAGFIRRMPAIGENRALEVFDLVLPRADAPAVWSTLIDAGVKPAGHWAYEAHRVAALRPRLTLDTDDRAIPHELNLIGTAAEEGAVHLEKGCYRGQETVARVHNLGTPPRRLVLLHLDGSADVDAVPGAAITADGRTVGRLGTRIDHYELGPIALGLVKHAVPVDAQLEVAGMAAAIDAATFVDDNRIRAGRAAIDKLRGR